MRKLPTLFQRDPDDRAHVLPEVNPVCQWVLDGFGVPTRKYDGTCVMLDEAGDWWARREVKPGKTPPPDFVPVETDQVTGKTMGWEPIARSAFARWHAEAVAGAAPEYGFAPGTYELVGPKINGNPERRDGHHLIAHRSAEEFLLLERTFEALRDQLLAFHALDGCEGVVFQHPDGRMAKLKARDFRRTVG